MAIAFVGLLGSNTGTFTCIGGPHARSLSVSGAGADPGDLVVVQTAFYNGSESGNASDSKGNIYGSAATPQMEPGHSIIDLALDAGDTITRMIACSGGGNSVKAVFASAFSGLGDAPEYVEPIGSSGMLPDNDEWLLIRSRKASDDGNTPPAEDAGWTTLWRGGGSSGIFEIWWYHSYKIVSGSSGLAFDTSTVAIKNGTPPPPPPEAIGAPAVGVGLVTPTHVLVGPDGRAIA